MGQMHSLELTFAPEDEQWVRVDWDALLEAGLPSKASSKNLNNAPHCSIAVSPFIPGDVDELAHEIFAPLLPLEIGVGGLLMFGHDPMVATRLVEAPAELAVGAHDFIARSAPHIDHLRTTWVPHITLARRLRRNRIQEFAELLQPCKGKTLTVTSLKRWDADNQVSTIII